MRSVRWAVAALSLVALCLACSGSGSRTVSAPRGKKDKPAEEEGPKAHWQVNHERAKGDALIGAVMDLWGGDPGPICFEGEPKFAARRMKKIFEGHDKFVSATPKEAQVVVTTKSPFGDDETSDFTFPPCP